MKGIAISDRFGITIWALLVLFCLVNAAFAHPIPIHEEAKPKTLSVEPAQPVAPEDAPASEDHKITLVDLQNVFDHKALIGMSLLLGAAITFFATKSKFLSNLEKEDKLGWTGLASLVVGVMAVVNGICYANNGNLLATNIIGGGVVAVIVGIAFIASACDMHTVTVEQERRKREGR